MLFYNPKPQVDELQVILSNPSKKIGFLFGAGISIKDSEGKYLIVASDDITEDDGNVKKGMITLVVDQITDEVEKQAIEEIKKEIEESEKFNLERLLSKISEKERAVGNDTLCGLAKGQLEKLRQKIEDKIKDIVSVHGNADFSERKLSHQIFGQWIKNADRHHSVEIFTTNYDYLLEYSLEKNKVPYFDGFIGSYNAFFCPELIEMNDSSAIKNWTKLWKMHGSLGWKIEDGDITRTSMGAGNAIIYPSYLKYDHSRKQPYLSYMDRLSNFLKQEDSVLFICGYSFGDQHINSAIVSALAQSRSSHVYVLKSGELKEGDDLSKKIAQQNSKISVFAKRTAIIGCKFGEWRLTSKEESSLSFKSDELEPGEKWEGKGEFLLGNFTEFTKFLFSL